MKTSRNILIVLLFLVSACSEVVDSEYSTLDVARKENALRTGLLPDWLPNTSRQIIVAFDVSTTGKILTFQYKTTEGWNPLEFCKRIDPVESPKPHITREWWPENILTKTTHTFYTCENGDSFLAAHPKSGQAFYWNAKA